MHADNEAYTPLYLGVLSSASTPGDLHLQILPAIYRPGEEPNTESERCFGLLQKREAPARFALQRERPESWVLICCGVEECGSERGHFCSTVEEDKLAYHLLRSAERRAIYVTSLGIGPEPVDIGYESALLAEVENHQEACPQYFGTHSLQHGLLLEV